MPTIKLLPSIYTSQSQKYAITTPQHPILTPDNTCFAYFSVHLRIHMVNELENKNIKLISVSCLCISWCIFCCFDSADRPKPEFLLFPQLGWLRGPSSGFLKRPQMSPGILGPPANPERFAQSQEPSSLRASKLSCLKFWKFESLKIWEFEKFESLKVWKFESLSF